MLGESQGVEPKTGGARWRYMPLSTAVGLVLLAITGCGNCDDEVAAANEFIAANQSCVVDDDCAVVDGACNELEGSFCGQVAVRRQAAESARWQGLRRALADCGPDSCDRCLALLVPACTNGRCSRPR
jgi:hypothetical protein